MLKTLVVTVIVLQQTVIAQDYLHEYVDYYETLSYDKERLLHDHHRLRRSVGKETSLKLSFEAFEKKFELQLEPDSLHSDFELVINGRTHPKLAVDSHYYIGHDINDPTLYVHGSLAFGVFDGSIHGSNETYYIEPADRYFENAYNNMAANHSIIYRHSDSIRYTGNQSVSFCGRKHNLLKRRQLRTEGMGSHQLQARSDNGVRDTKKVRCSLNVVADNYFYEAVTSKGKDWEYRTAQAISTIKNIVLGASNNFEKTDFDDDGAPDNISFGISKITVRNVSNSSDVLSDRYLGVESLLNLFSYGDHDEYCLSYLFTYRDFDDGVLGLAFLAETDGSSSAGVCGKEQRYSDGSKTLNTGVVSLVNYGQRVTQLVSQITFTHEAGHNFGSDHDTDECVGKDGNNYVMFARASSGRESNNKKFSQCSIDQIFPILRDKAQSSDDSVGCLKYADDNCGNSLLDEGEYCDCGYQLVDSSTGLCRNDPCCNGTTCLLANSAECTPQLGPCCDSLCNLVPAIPEVVCSDETDCTYNQTCNGTVAFCPEAEPVQPEEGETAVVCNSGSNYCVNGACTGSICVPLQLTDCDCSGNDYQCHICCMLGNGTCASTIVLAQENSTAKSLLPNGKGNVLGVGFPCNNYEGYCDFFNVCRSVNSDGAIKRITNLIRGTEAVQLSIGYVKRYWWGPIVGCAVLLLAALFIVGISHVLLRKKGKISERRGAKGPRRIQVHPTAGTKL